MIYQKCLKKWVEHRKIEKDTNEYPHDELKVIDGKGNVKIPCRRNLGVVRMDDFDICGVMIWEDEFDSIMRMETIRIIKTGAKNEMIEYVVKY